MSKLLYQENGKTFEFPFHTGLQCFVRQVLYDFKQKRGVILCAGVTDMRGAIALCKSIDPGCAMIESYDEHDKLDSLYVLRSGEWIAKEVRSCNISLIC